MAVEKSKQILEMKAISRRFGGGGGEGGGAGTIPFPFCSI